MTARVRWAVLATMLAAGCAGPSREGGGVVQEVAEGYVRLVLAVGQHDPDYVDAYYGPPAWKAEADSATVALDVLAGRASALRERLTGATADSGSLAWLRIRYLDRQLAAVETRIAMLGGTRLPFDAEAQALYDAAPPHFDEAHFQTIIDRLDPLLPGAGTIAERYQAFRSQFVIPAGRVDTVFQVAIQECRARTARWMPLPAGEHFTVEYVTDKPWSGYNWYQGKAQSLIQVNVSLPIYIDRAIDLACHEGYPGHHVYNASLEQALVRDRGWVVHSIPALQPPVADRGGVGQFRDPDGLPRGGEGRLGA